MPESFWKTAVELARQYGVWQTARPLRLDYTGLKNRLAVSLAMAYPEAKTIHLVMDNLNINRQKALADVFGVEMAAEVWNLLAPVRNDSRSAGKTPAARAGLGVSRHASNLVDAPAKTTSDPSRKAFVLQGGYLLLRAGSKKRRCSSALPTINSIHRSMLHDASRPWARPTRTKPT